MNPTSTLRAEYYFSQDNIHALGHCKLRLCVVRDCLKRPLWSALETHLVLTETTMKHFTAQKTLRQADKQTKKTYH